LAHEFKDGDAVIVDVNRDKEIVLKRSRKRAALLKKAPVKDVEEKTEQVPA
jgi:antitoxin component of MazEF toxin-antitoxin module